MRIQGVSRLDSKQYPQEYYKISIVAKATGLSPAYLRKSALPKYRFGNALFLNVAQVNRHIESACVAGEI